MAKVNFDSTPVKQFLNIYFNYLNSLNEYESEQLISKIHEAHLNSLPVEMRERIASALYNSSNPNFIRNFTSMAIYNLGCRGDIATLQIPSHLIDIFCKTFQITSKASSKFISEDTHLQDSHAKIKEKVQQIQEIKNQSKINKTVSESNAITSAEELVPKNWTSDDLRRSFLMSEIIRLPRCKRRKIR